MTAMPALRDILNNTPADATDVDFNFQTIEGHIGAEMINRDGSIAMTGALTLSGPPVADDHAASKGYVDTAVVPVGSITMFAGAAAPAGWAICDGTNKTITDPDYADLFAVIGYAFGGTVGMNFNLPDLRGRFPVGIQAGQAIWDTLGETGGSRDAAVVNHTHTTPNHSHAMGAHTHGMDHNHDPFNTSADGAHAHNPAAGSAYTFFSRRAGVGTTQLGVSAGTEQWNDSNVTATANAHDHEVNVPNYTGDTQAMNGSPVTGNAAPTTNNPAGGVAVTDRNLPPYLGLNFIIRIG